MWNVRVESREIIGTHIVSSTSSITWGFDLMNLWGIFLKSKSLNPTYELVDIEPLCIIKRHKKYLKLKLGLEHSEIPDSLPFIYWIPKMHKKPFSKPHYLAAAHKCSTKPIYHMMSRTNWPWIVFQYTTMYFYDWNTSQQHHHEILNASFFHPHYH